MTMHCEHCGKEVTSAYCHACGKAASTRLIRHRKLIGVCLIVVPWVALTAILSVYAIARFVTDSLVDATASSILIETAYADGHATSGSWDDGFIVGDPGGYGDEQREMAEAAASLVNVVMGFLGLLCAAGILIGTPLGIYLLATDGKPKNGVAEGGEKR